MSGKESEPFEFEINPTSPYEGKSDEGKTSPSKEDSNVFVDDHSGDEDGGGGDGGGGGGGGGDDYDYGDDDDDDDDDDDVGEEVYSIYDDDEAWPRKLQGSEIGSAEQFFEAVECGECDVVDRLLEEFPQLVNVTRQKQGGDFSLYIAAGMGDLEMAETLLTSKGGKEGEGNNNESRVVPVQVHARTVHGHTALSAAALFGHPLVVELLMECGLDVNSKNVEGLILIDEVLDDIDYSVIGDMSEEDEEDEMLENSTRSITTKGGGSDPLLLEKAAILLLRGGAEISSSNVFAFHDKFCGAWGDVTDVELQDAIEDGCQAATKKELEQERTNEERARTPALVVRRLSELNEGSVELSEQSRPSLFKGSGGSDADTIMGVDGFTEMSPSSGEGRKKILKKSTSPRVAVGPRVSPRVSPRVAGPPSNRSRAGSIRQRRYVRSPKVATTGATISPQKPPSPDKNRGNRSASSSPSSSKKSVRPRGSPRTPRVIEDLSAMIQEEAGREEDDEGPDTVHSDDSLDVSWSKQCSTPPAIPPRPRSHGDGASGDILEESHPPRVHLPVIGSGKKK